MKRFNSAIPVRFFCSAAIVCAFLSFCCTCSFAVDTVAPKPTTSPYFPAGQTSVIVPFDSYSNLVLVQAQINGAGPLTFALDTAFQSSLIDKDAATALKLPIMHGDGSSSAGQAQFVTFDAKIADLTLPHEIAKVVSLSELPSLLGVKIDGILGVDVFQRFGVTINYQTRAITFTQNGMLSPPSDSDPFPITESPKGLIIPVQLSPQKGEPMIAYARIDTGSIDALALSEAFVRSSTILIPKQQEILVPGGFGETPLGEQVFVTRLGAIQLGRYEFKSPIALHNNDITPHPYSVTIGGEILRRFTVTFDLEQSRLFLVPNSSVHQPFIFDGSGMTLAASGPTLHTYTVTAVRPFSPAADAQLQPGDVITNFNDQPTDSLTLADIRAMLCQVGTMYHATILRGGKTHIVYLNIKWRV